MNQLNVIFCSYIFFVEEISASVLSVQLWISRITSESLNAGVRATVSSLNFTHGHRIDLLGLFLSQVYFHISEVGEGRGVGS